MLLGDAANSEIMAHAHLDRARVLTITSAQEASAELVVRNVRESCPSLRVVTRADSADGVARMVEAGAEDVVSPELEGGIELMRHTLLDLGYRPRQIQAYANDLRESGYEALDDDAKAKRMVALDRLMTSLGELDLYWAGVQEGSEADGLTLAELDLRARTGASAVVLRHGKDLSLVVNARTRLRAGDAVGLMGTSSQLTAAEGLFTAPSAATGGQGRSDPA